MSPFRLALVAFLLTVLSGSFTVAWRLAQRADEICRDRATLSTNVTLCRGEVRATSMIGEIGCECGGGP